MAQPELQIKNEIIGKNIRAERNRVGMSQIALAKAISVSEPVIVHMETGRTSQPITRLYAVAEVLGVSIYDLLPAEPVAA